MAYDDQLAERVRAQLGDRHGLSEKKMFGGLAFLLHGNMCCGVHGEGLIVRLGADKMDAALARPGARVFDMTGRPMKGWVVVDPPGIRKDADLGAWVDLAAEHASALPPK